MKAYGMHIKVRTEKADKSTCNNAMEATFMQPCRGIQDSVYLDFVPMEYVGWVEEIITLNYSSHCVIVLVCSWVREITEGPYSTIKRDEFGFTLRKLLLRECSIGPQSFAFPINV
jgi:hypothetical protein